MCAGLKRINKSAVCGSGLKKASAFCACIFILVGCGSYAKGQTLFTVAFDPASAFAVNFGTITEALDKVDTMKGGYEIWVKQGRYTEAELEVPGNVGLYGGFRGDERRRDQRSRDAGLTILDGGLSHRVACVSGRLDGFLIQNGRTPDCGGGIRLIGGNIQNCIVQNNQAGDQGGGIFCEGYTNVVQGCVVRYNTSPKDTAVITGHWRGKGNVLKQGFRVKSEE